jgi:hypothetical protein
MRSLREIVRYLRPTPEERVEHCLEALFDPEQCACAHPGDLGEREESALEAERLRWAGPQAANDTFARSSTGS